MLSYADSTSPELSVLAGVLQPLLTRARTTGVDLMVVGAMARDLLVHHAQGTRPDRATRDIDIALAVARWSDLDDVMSSHPRVGDSPHRFLVRGVEVDVVPFRGVETSSRTIRWPNDHVMAVLGFEEALRSAVLVELPGGVVAPVASLPAQSLLKLLAWRDRRQDTRKDAVDLRTILVASGHENHLEQLYDNHPDLLESYGFDPGEAAAHRLGAQARALVDRDAAATVLALLVDDEFVDQLTAASGPSTARGRLLLHAYRRGWVEGV
ncbi:hypothetical protein ACFEMC_00065 [Kineococcus sp. DHX-1]|uniref:hypothetical protein n=1 Tax=Kineococcus sp. DHX-1 TaxID=3349638 RepID=UPI0036D3385A